MVIESTSSESEAVSARGAVLKRVRQPPPHQGWVQGVVVVAEGGRLRALTFKMNGADMLGGRRAW